MREVATRSVKASDEPFLKEMAYEAAYAPGVERPAFTEVAERQYLKNLADGWGKQGDIGVIAEHGMVNQPVGAAWCRQTALIQPVTAKKWPELAEVPELTIALRAEARGQRIGGLLLNALLTEAEHQHVEMINLVVAKSNKVALRLYQSRGFEISREVSIGSPPEPAYMMEKFLF